MHNDRDFASVVVVNNAAADGDVFEGQTATWFNFGEERCWNGKS